MRARTNSRATLGAAAMLSLAALSGLTFSNTIRAVLDGGGTEIRASFDTTRQLATGSQVRIAGVEVGEVKAIELEPDGRGAMVTMEVDEEIPPLRRDARAQIKFRSLVGGSMIVALDPGSPSAGALGDQSIPRERTSTQVEVDDITADALGTDARSGLQALLSEVPRALDQPRALGGALDALDDAAPAIKGGVSAARGIQERDLRLLITAAARATRAMDAPSEPVGRLIAGGAQTATAVAAEQVALRQTLRQTARALPITDATLARLDTTLRGLDPLVAQLNASAPDVGPALHALRGTVRRADLLLRDAPPLLRQLRPAVANLAAAARGASPLLDGLDPSIKRVDRSILPNLAKPDPVTKRPTFQMLGPGVTSVMSVSGQYDGEGYFARLAAGAGERAVDTLPCRSTALDPERPEILNCAALTQALRAIFEGIPPRTRGKR